MKYSCDIVLMVAPFWTPMIPPMGICSIKSYLEKNNFKVKTFDLNVEEESRVFYKRYFDFLDVHIPESKKGNFYSIGHEVLRNHLMAFIHGRDNSRYFELINILVKKTFFVDLKPSLLIDLDSIISNFYKWLETFINNVIEKYKPEKFGLTVYRDTLPASIFIYKTIKRINSKITTIMGGSIFSEQLIVDTPDYNYFIEKSKSYLDKIFIGDGEYIFLDYLQGKLEYKRIYMEEKRYDFNDFLPNYIDMDINKYLYLGITGSYGCKYQCSFCNVFKYYGNFRAKNIKKLVDEMEILNKEYDISFFYLTDHMINPIINELSNEIIKRKLEIYWTAYLRVDDQGADINNTMLWRKGGFYCARLGIESGSQKILDLMGKKITPDLSYRVLQNLANAGIKTTAYFLVGHPGETKDDFKDTLNFIDKTKDLIWEAETDYFNFNFTGQANSDDWVKLRKLVYPDWSREILLIQRWEVNTEPFRDEVFSRVSQFVNHCSSCGIPNTYSLNEIFHADNRWKSLHKNSVPSFMNVNENIFVDICRDFNSEEFSLAKTIDESFDKFNF